MPILDALTQTEDAIIARLNEDATLASYNWQRWESDVNVVQPRGYVNVAQEAAWQEHTPAPDMMRVEVVLEGKPKRGSLAATVAILRGILGDPALHIKLNVIVTDESITYLGPAEQLSIRQELSGDLRVRQAVFMIAAQWNVIYE